MVTTCITHIIKKLKSNKALIAYLVLIMPITGLFGQAPQFESFKVLKNINNVQVNEIAQDMDGFIWLGTNYGLVKYDGVDFKLFTVHDNLYSNYVTSLEIDPFTGNIWIGHKTGEISIFNRNKIERFDPEEGLSSKEISSLFVDNAGIIWFTTLDEGVYYYKGKNRKRLYNINTDDGLLDNYAYSIVQIKDSLYYIATDKGISIYNLNQKRIIDELTTKDGLPDNLVKKIILKSPYLWIGMNDGGVCKYDIDKKSFSAIYSWNFGALTDMINTGENEIYCSTDKKAIIRIEYDNNNIPKYSNYSKSNGIIDKRTKSIFSDREGNIWVGTKKGLSVRKNNNIEFLDANSKFDITQIFGITIDKDNRFWLATQNGLFTYHRDNMGHFTTKRILNIPGLESAIYISIFRDVYNMIWVGSYGYGVFKIDSKTLDYKQFKTSDGIANNDIFHITGDSTNIWLSTAGGGVSRISLSDNKIIKNFNVKGGLPSNYIYSIYIENPNKVWLATDGGGVAIIENDKPQTYKNALLDSLGNKIYAITKDKTGNLWFNVADNGVVKVNDQNEYFHFNVMNGLSSNSNQSIICNCNNQIIISSNHGIDILNTQSSQTYKFGEKSNVTNLEPNLNASYKDNFDNVYFGTVHGIVKINLHKSDTLKPKIILTEKRLYLNEIDSSKTIFNYKENNLSFSYTALWFKASKSLVYRYQLVGYDLDWNNETTLKSVTYPKLPHGNYKFEVQVKLQNGEWYGSDKSSFEFKIKPPFWKTPWFIAISLILVIILIYSFINYRIQKLKRDKEILEEEVVKRTAEIRAQKEEIEAQRDEIEAQRNFVTEQRDRIEGQNKNITSSIHYASRIQKAVLPPKENFENIFEQYFIFFKPRDIVSGDFYYLNEIDNHIIVAAADCTGHGVPGAFMSLLGVALLNQIISSLPDNFNAATILDSLRSDIKKSLRQTGKDDEAKDGMDISLCVIDKNQSKLEFAGAYNPLLIIRDKEIITYKADKMPIGVYIKDENNFTNNTIKLVSKDMLYLYSDGFQDQFGGTNNRKFLPKQLKNLLLSVSNLSMDKQKKALDDTFYKWKGEEHQVDDVLIMGIRI